jgi:hypothetical protein
MIDRGRVLGRFRVQWPEFDAAFAAKATTWLLVLAAAAGALWLGAKLMPPRRRQQSGP